MAGEIKELIFAKYERNGWPAQVRPDIKLVAGWSQELIASVSRPRAHVPSPDGKQIALSRGTQTDDVILLRDSE